MFKCSNFQMFWCSYFQILNVKCQISLRLNFCRSVPLEFLRSFFDKKSFYYSWGGCSWVWSWRLSLESEELLKSSLKEDKGSGQNNIGLKMFHLKFFERIQKYKKGSVDILIYFLLKTIKTTSKHVQFMKGQLKKA